MSTYFWGMVGLAMAFLLPLVFMMLSNAKKSGYLGAASTDNQRQRLSDHKADLRG